MAASMSELFPTVKSRKRTIEPAFLCLVVLILIDIGGLCSEDGYEGFLLCRKCGHEIAQSSNLVSIPTMNAVRQRNTTSIPGSNDYVLIQLLRNPHGMTFEVVTSSEADVLKSKEKYEDSWFPGFAWSFANCPKCGTQIGWGFDAVDGYVQRVKTDLKTFVAIILDKVMHEQDAMDLIATPKAYLS